MANIDPLFSILDYCDCNRLAPIGLWRRMIELYAIRYQPCAILGSKGLGD